MHAHDSVLNTQLTDALADDFCDICGCSVCQCDGAIAGYDGWIDERPAPSEPCWTCGIYTPAPDSLFCTECSNTVLPTVEVVRVPSLRDAFGDAVLYLPSEEYAPSAHPLTVCPDCNCYVLRGEECRICADPDGLPF